jgi:hypothetical protein
MIISKINNLSNEEVKEGKEYSEKETQTIP